MTKGKCEPAKMELTHSTDPARRRRRRKLVTSDWIQANLGASDRKVSKSQAIIAYVGTTIFIRCAIARLAKPIRRSARLLRLKRTKLVVSLLLRQSLSYTKDFSQVDWWYSCPHCHSMCNGRARKSGAYNRCDVGRVQSSIILTSILGEKMATFPAMITQSVATTRLV